MYELYCINLIDRSDKLESLKKNIKENNFKCKLIVIEAIKHNKGEIGCGLSHQKIIKLAQKKNLEKIIVLEDDCLFNDKSYELFEKCMKQLPKDFDIFLGGISGGEPEKKITNNICKLKSFTATQFIIYSKSIYNKILEYKKGNIDVYISNLIKKNNLNVYCSYPFISTQLTCYSDIKKKIKNYDRYFEKSLKKVEKVFI